MADLVGVAAAVGDATAATVADVAGVAVVGVVGVAAATVDGCCFSE